MVNIVGEPAHSGPVRYEGLEEVLKMENVFVHLYGKKETKPGRKMGHLTVISNERQDLIYKVNRIKQTLFAKAQ
jgi:5-(carboxyamino)imidazole ribonucleotide synthase